MRGVGAALALATWAVGGAGGQEPVLLRLTAPAGQVNRYRTGLRLFLDEPGELPAIRAAPALLQCGGVTETVDSVTGGVRVVRAVTDSAHLEMPGLPGAFPALAAGALRGLTVSARLDPQGRVLATAAGGPGLDPSPLGALAAALHIAPRLPAFPEAALRVGDSWTDTQRVATSSAGSRISGWMRSTSRLEGLRRIGASRVARVAVQGVARYSVDAGTLPVTVTMTTEGRFAWDVDRGRLVRLSGRASGRLRLPSLPQEVPFHLSLATALAGAGAPELDSLCAAHPPAPTVSAPAAPPAESAAVVGPPAPAPPPRVAAETARAPSADSAAEAALLDTLRADLVRLVGAEERYYASRGTYVADLDSVGFRPSPGVTVRFGVVGRSGWNATATAPGTSRSCALFVGNAPTPLHGQYEREPRCR